MRWGFKQDLKLEALAYTTTTHHSRLARDDPGQHKLTVHRLHCPVLRTPTLTDSTTPPLFLPGRSSGIEIESGADRARQQHSQFTFQRLRSLRLATTFIQAAYNVHWNSHHEPKSKSNPAHHLDAPLAVDIDHCAIVHSGRSVGEGAFRYWLLLACYSLWMIAGLQNE